MKVGKPSVTNVKEIATLSGGAFAGAAAGRAAWGFIHTPNPTPSATEENTVLAKQLGLTLVGGALAASVSGKDTWALLVRGAGIGLAWNFGSEAIKIAAKKFGVKEEASANTEVEKLAARALGLGCPCTSGLGNPVQLVRVPQFREIDFNEYADARPSGAQISNPIADAVNSGYLIAS